MFQNNKYQFKWEKPRKPLVTECCGSLNFVVTNRGVLCHKCNNVIYKSFGVRQATAQDMRNNGLSYSDEEFNSVYK